MPKPQSGESQSEFVSRCISEVTDEGIPQDEAVGRCFGIWESEKSKSDDMNETKEKPDCIKQITFESFSIKEDDVIVENEQMQVASFEGIANVMETVDLGGDIIHKGAFKKSIEENNGVPFVTDHTYKIKNYLGMAYLEEQGNLLKANVEVLVSNNEEGKSFLSKARFAKARGKGLGLSIGYDIPEGKAEMKDGVRHIYEVKVHELSAVVFPMNEGSRAVGFKSFKWNDLEETKAQIEKLLELKGHSLGNYLMQSVNEMAATEEDRKRIVGELAQESGMSRQRVAEVLNGDMIRPSDQVLQAFSSVLDVPMQQLLTLADNDIGKSGHEDDEDTMSEHKQVEAVSPSDADDQDSFMTVCVRVLDHMNIEDSDEERSQICLSAWQEAMEGEEANDDQKALQELNQELKSLLNDEPSSDTHDEEADLLELNNTLKQINKSHE